MRVKKIKGGRRKIPVLLVLGGNRAEQQVYHHGSFECLILAKALTPQCRVHTTQWWCLAEHTTV